MKLFSETSLGLEMGRFEKRFSNCYGDSEIVLKSYIKVQGASQIILYLYEMLLPVLEWMFGEKKLNGLIENKNTTTFM